MLKRLLKLFRRSVSLVRGLSATEKAVLEMLISDIQEALPDADRVREVLKSWIEANDLHPERVKKVELKAGEWISLGNGVCVERILVKRVDEDTFDVYVVGVVGS